MRFRKVVIGAAAVMMFVGVSTIASGAASNAGRHTVARHVSRTPTLTKAHWLALAKAKALPTTYAHTSFAHALPLGGAAFSSDSYFPNDIPKDQAGTAPTLAAAPVVPTSQFQGGHDNGTSSTLGVNAFDQGQAHTPSFDVEPPDQGLCAGNGFVMEPVNLVLRVYHEHNFAPASPALALETLFGNPYAFGYQGGDVTVQGDVRCYFDHDTNRWYVTQLYVDEDTLTSAFQIAVSTSANPLGSYNVYQVNDTDPSDPGCPCLGDQPLLGVNQNAIFITVNEFPFYGGFNGSVVFALDKAGMVAGHHSVNVWSDTVGLNVPTPDGACSPAPFASTCWYSIQPATSSNEQWGTEYALSALDFVNAGDHRVAVWAFTNTQSITSHTPNIQVSDSIVRSEPYIFPPLVRQKAGPIPLGDVGYGAPEGPLNNNDDRMNQVVYSDGILWSGVNTGVNVGGNLQAGIAWFAVAPYLTLHGVGGIMWNQGYVAPPGADVLFPSIALNDDGQGILNFTLSGPSNYPSAAYEQINRFGAGPVRIAVAGQSPQDGFTEYQGYPNIDPRWGDYSAAVADGDSVFFATEMIQHPNCSDTAFLADTTCGGTRDTYANWGTSLSVFKS